MSKYFIVLFIGLLIFSSCSEEKPPIEPAQMSEILSQLHLAEAYAQLNTKDVNGYQSKDIDSLIIIYSHIYSKHNIDSASFKTALRWYENHPEQFDNVYETVLSNLSIQKEIGTKDSLQLPDTSSTKIMDTL